MIHRLFLVFTICYFFSASIFSQQLSVDNGDTWIDFSVLSSPIDLSDQTSLLLKGNWMGEHTVLLRSSIKPEEENNTLKSVDMSSVDFIEGGEEHIAYSLFSNCYELEQVIFPEKEQLVRLNFAYLFLNCNKLKEIVNFSMQKNVRNFELTFKNCYLLKEIVLPEGNIDINFISFSGAFENCRALTRVENLDKFDCIYNLENAFRECDQLETIVLPRGNKNNMSGRFDYAFYNCTQLKEVKNLEFFVNSGSFESTFYGCESLEEISMPINTGYSLQYIDLHYTFYGCKKLKHVYNLETFSGEKLFLALTWQYCTSLISVKLPVINSTAEALDLTFDNANINCLIYLPESSDEELIPEHWNNVLIGNTALDHITYWSGYPYERPESFNLREGKKIRCAYKMDQVFTGNAPYSTISIPFDGVFRVGEQTYLPGTDDSDTGSFYCLLGYESNNFNQVYFTYKNALNAYTPYLMKIIQNNLWKNLSANNDVVYVECINDFIPEEPVVDLIETDLLFMGATTPLEESRVYLLHYESETGNVLFRYHMNAEIPSFKSYFKLYGASWINETLFINESTTSIKDEYNVSNGLNYWLQDGVLVLESKEAKPASIYGLDGRVMQTIDLIEGLNFIEDLLPGYYIIEGNKVVIN